MTGYELLWALSSHPDPATTGATPHKPYINPKRHLGFVEEERALQKKKARRKQFHATCRTYEFTYHATPSLSLSLSLSPSPPSPLARISRYSGLFVDRHKKVALPRALRLQMVGGGLRQEWISRYSGLFVDGHKKRGLTSCAAAANCAPAHGTWGGLRQEGSLDIAACL